MCNFGYNKCLFLKLLAGNKMTTSSASCHELNVLNREDI
jgi:hypothetical protein